MIKQGQVATLRIPADVWDALAPQQQMLHLVQQVIGFMASPYYGEMDGMQVIVSDINNVASSRTVFKVGAEPTSVIQIN